MASTRNFYGFEFRYGRTALWSGDDPRARHNHVGSVHVFFTRADRDEWVKNRRTDHLDEPGYREAVSRAWLRRNGDDPDSVEFIMRAVFQLN